MPDQRVGGNMRRVDLEGAISYKIRKLAGFENVTMEECDLLASKIISLILEHWSTVGIDRRIANNENFEILFNQIEKENA